MNLTPKALTLNLLRKIANQRARSLLHSNSALWASISDYLTKSNSTGCSFSDYGALYSYVRKNKPKIILECGTGVSTVIMAHALSENKAEGSDGRIVSMEEHEGYYELAQRIMPPQYRPYAEIVLSPTVEDTYSLFRGVRYKDIPKLDYDFVFVDGPSYKAPSDGMLTFDFDFIHVVKNSLKPVDAIIDKRVSTCYVLQKVFGPEKVFYDGVRNLGFAKNCSAADLGDFDPKAPSRAFKESIKPFYNSKLDFFLD